MNKKISLLLVCVLLLSSLSVFASSEKDYWYSCMVYRRAQMGIALDAFSDANSALYDVEASNKKTISDLKVEINVMKVQNVYLQGILMINPYNAEALADLAMNEQAILNNIREITTLTNEINAAKALVNKCDKEYIFWKDYYEAAVTKYNSL